MQNAFEHLKEASRVWLRRFSPTEYQSSFLQVSRLTVLQDNDLLPDGRPSYWCQLNENG